MMQRQPLGIVSTTEKYIDYADMCLPSVTSLQAAVATGSPVSAYTSKSWQVDGVRCASSRTGIVYVSQDFGDNKVNAYDLHGHMKMETMATGYIRGLGCFLDNSTEMIVLTTERRVELGGESAKEPGNKIELRDGKSGALLDSLVIPGFSSFSGICQDTDNTILVSGEIDKQAKVIQCLIKDGKISKSGKEVVMPIPYISGLVSVFCDKKKVLFAISRKHKAIVAVDFETGSTVWEMKNKEYKGKEIEPHGMGTDRGHSLFIADYEGRRILVINCNGTIERDIITDIPHCRQVTCVPALRKLAVTDGNYNVYTYNVQYSS